MSSTWILRCQEPRGTLWGTELKPEAAGSGLRCSLETAAYHFTPKMWPHLDWHMCAQDPEIPWVPARRRPRGLALNCEQWRVLLVIDVYASKSLTQLKARLFLSSLGTWDKSAGRCPLRAQLLPGLDKTFSQQWHPLGSCLEQLESQFCADQRLGGGFGNFLQPEQCFEWMSCPVTIPLGLLAAYQLGPVSCLPPSFCCPPVLWQLSHGWRACSQHQHLNFWGMNVRRGFSL